MFIVLKNKEVKIKKERVCWGCSVKYPIGRLMTYVVSVEGHDFGYTYWCEICNAFMSQHSGDFFEDGVREGEFKGEIEYESFKHFYLCQRREVIIEKTDYDLREMKKALNGVDKYKYA